MHKSIFHAAVLMFSIYTYIKKKHLTEINYLHKRHLGNVHSPHGKVT